MNPYGYFDDDNREYVITRPDTPLPWLNYLGQDDLFGLCTNTGGGYTFYRDAKLRRLTRYRYNEIPYDNNGRYLYIKDGDTIWNPTWKPTRTALDRYECRHGLGYSRITAEKNGIEVEVLFFIPNNETVELWKTTVRNKSGQARDIQLFSFIEFCLYEAQNDATNYQRTYSIGEVEQEDGVIYHKTEYRERRSHYTIFGCTHPVAGFDTSRDAFVGVHNGLHDPKVVLAGKSANSIAHGWNPIGSHSLDLHLAGGEEKVFTFVLGYVEVGDAAKFDAPFVMNKAAGRAIMEKYSDVKDVDRAFTDMTTRWDERLGVFQVQSPSPELNRMGNIWNQVQCMTTFNLSRSASLFETGIGRGMGYRDSNQDILGFVHMVPEKARQRVLDIAATQMSSGLCFHQYQPLTKKGNADIGGGFMDDHLWLVLSTCAYIKETGDTSILSEDIGYADQPDDAKSGTLLDHLELSIRYCLENVGPHGLPLIGHADWNDCLNLNCFSTEPNESFQLAGHGADDKVAESVMIAGLFLNASDLLAGLYDHLGQAGDAARIRAGYDTILSAVDQHGWDGKWFVRAYDAYGKPVGSAVNEEGRIYIESQGWCILGGVGIEDGRARTALDSVHEHLFFEHGCVLQQPAYSEYHVELGEVSSYPPGYKENAGVFCHNNPWIQFALMKLGDGDRAFLYYLSICPAAKEDIIDTYRAEPYVYSQMIAGKDAANPGEAKNAWLTGCAAWTFLTVSQGFCGIQPDYTGLRLDPCIPSHWPEFKVTRKFRGATYDITVKNPSGKSKGITSLVVDGQMVPGNIIPTAPAGRTVTVEAVLA
ncbi:cellobiose phosphorylase [Terrimicrobium sacchariphilum]|uniref:Cellobiose phosphorylase n=1 Tax=Terrimicrobium sacchariphilum TaxID=690879 RepID=A0A146GDI8_TERSA|nr:glycosyl transferase [Terrimicrobium sacchariphilum]GAT35411.1 cellobiose phosphorylase [Terrimicrobium sacchariphilum]